MRVQFLEFAPQTYFVINLFAFYAVVLPLSFFFEIARFELQRGGVVPCLFNIVVELFDGF